MYNKLHQYAADDRRVRFTLRLRLLFKGDFVRIR